MLDAKSPDTSKPNIIRVLRTAIYEECNALADVLAATSTVSWEERVSRAANGVALHDDDGLPPSQHRVLADAALRAAFPEMAP